MKVVIRTDSSAARGSGHIMRCLTLAAELRPRGAETVFICRELPGDLSQFVESMGFPVHRLPALDSEFKSESEHAAWHEGLWLSDAEDTRAVLESLPRQDWLVVDSYDIDSRWEKKLRPIVGRIMVIDDLADRSHDCDLLLDQNFYRDLDQRYQGLVPDKCITLLGPEYVLLRPEFTEAKQRLRSRDGNIQRILVCFGGSDPTNETQKVVEALTLINRSDLWTDIVVGAVNPKRSIIQSLCDKLANATFYCQVSNMSELIQKADLGVGAGGSAMWERCYLGLPTITVVIAANQESTTKDVASIGAIHYLGWSSHIQADDYAHAIAWMSDNQQKVKEISNAALEVLRPSGKSIVEMMFSFF